MEFNSEKDIAARAERMLTNGLRAKTSGFASHVRNTPKDKSLKDAVGVAKLKTYGSAAGGTKTYMTTLSIKMAKHGFIQHHGVDNQRNGGSRTRKKPKDTTYNFSAHYFKMPEKPFINAAINQSNVIPFVMENLVRFRSEELLFEVRRIIEHT